MRIYPPDVFQAIGQAHRDVANQFFRIKVKEIVFLGGGTHGEPCITRLVGFDRRHRPPIIELEVAFPKLATVRAWLPAHEHLLDRQTIRLTIDPEDRRPADKTTIVVTTDYGIFTGTVGHRGTAWCLNWSCLFNGKPLETAPTATAPAPTASSAT